MFNITPLPYVSTVRVHRPITGSDICMSVHSNARLKRGTVVTFIDENFEPHTGPVLECVAASQSERKRPFQKVRPIIFVESA